MNKWIHTRQKKTGRTKKLDEGKEGKTTKPNDDMVYLKRDIMEALRKSDEKMDSYSRKTDEKMNDFSRKADELLEWFMLITSTVGSQIQGTNSSIVKMQETNEKTKEGENKFNQFEGRIIDM